MKAASIPNYFSHELCESACHVFSLGLPKLECPVYSIFSCDISSAKFSHKQEIVENNIYYLYSPTPSFFLKINFLHVYK